MTDNQFTPERPVWSWFTLGTHRYKGQTIDPEQKGIRRDGCYMVMNVRGNPSEFNGVCVYCKESHSFERA